MSLDNYLVRSNEPFEEMQNDFLQEDIQQLYNHVKTLGYAGYLSFVREHLEDILKYVGLTQSQRRQKKWINHPDIVLIRWAAIQASGGTVRFLNEVRPITMIVDQGSYRSFLATVASALVPRILKSPFEVFPFEFPLE